MLISYSPLGLIEGLVLTVSVKYLIESFFLLIYWRRILDFVNGFIMVVIRIIIRLYFILKIEIVSRIVSLLKDSLKVYKENYLVSHASHFAENLKNIEEVSIRWPVQKLEKDLKDLLVIEHQLADVTIPKFHNNNNNNKLKV